MKYLQTVDELKEAAFADLGLMTAGSFDHFLARAEEAAADANVPRPRIMLSLHYKEPSKHLAGLRAVPYPISPDEWGIFTREIDEYLTEIPRVYVVDGSRYSAGI